MTSAFDTSERTEIGRRRAVPPYGMIVNISRKVGLTRSLSDIVDAVSSTVGAAGKRAKVSRRRAIPHYRMRATTARDGRKARNLPRCVDAPPIANTATE